MAQVPIVVVCYNNYKYVENTINQLVKININLKDDIIILDNKSTCEETIDFLKKTTCKVVFNQNNSGPQIWISNKEFHDSLPDKYIITDPDLELNESLPSNFVDILVNLSIKYNAYKVGFALDISDFYKMIDYEYHKGNNIFDWESRFWEHKIHDPDYEIYSAEIDTTFCLINKNAPYMNHIRVAGNFTAKHLPWYKDNKLLSICENYDLNVKTTGISTAKNIILKYIENNFIKVLKNNIYFFIKNDESDPNLHFWRNIYRNWENETFAVFDKYLNSNKIFIDIGAWVGTTCIYGSRKSKHVYAIDADIESIKSLNNNCLLNSKNITIINNAIFNKDNVDIKFGKNNFLENSKLNDSTSQIHFNNKINCDSYFIKTITLKSLVEKYDIDLYNVSLIKVDIEGAEEFILEDLFEIYNNFKVPMYISFHYSWWNDKNLDRFTFLTEENKNSIIKNPFISILFT